MSSYPGFKSWKPSGRRPHWQPAPGTELFGPAIRQAVMLVLIRTRRAMTTPEIQRELAQRGFTVRSERPGDAVRQALERETAKGRVDRPSRGHYRFVGAPETTIRRWRARFPWLC